MYLSHHHRVMDGTHMDDPVDVEISLRRRGSGRYNVEMRVMLPDSESETQPLRNAVIELDFKRLEDLQSKDLQFDSNVYGQALGEMFFKDSSFATAMSNAHIAAQSRRVPLRLRLRLPPEDEELHTLRWETLRDVNDPNNQLLTTSERVLFSRYLDSSDWRAVRSRSRTQMRALIVIASPTDLSEYGLQAIDVEHEIQLARTALSSIQLMVLGDKAPVTTEVLVNALREEYDIVYLLAHAALVKDETYVYLADAQGKVAMVAGRDLAAQIDQLMQRPRLFILAACQSAGDGMSQAFTSLGPRLAMAGIPAVIAMQGIVSIETVERLFPAFFTALQGDAEGHIDYAMAVARAQVHDQHDFWMPILFMRLKSGRIWYTPNFAADQRGPAERKWLALVASIRDQECTPIIGPDLLEGLVGSRRDMARALAEEHFFPLASHDREVLPQVTQFLAVNQSLAFLRRRIVQYLCEIMRQQGDIVLPEHIHLDLSSREQLLEIFQTILPNAWGAAQARNPIEPHSELARLPFPIYVTADPSDLLVQALTDAGKKPRVTFAPWNEHTRTAAMQFNKDRNYDPSVDEPLVYRLFGCLQDPDSLVLTENDHLDYLIGITRNKDVDQKRVRSMLANTALLFLGFRPEDWAFRVFFRHLMKLEGSVRRDNYAHIAVQVAPDEGHFRFPKQAQHYLEQYLSEGAHINIYWGGANDFVRQLNQHWSAGS
jgi:CHAT domain/SIR2-like domain